MQASSKDPSRSGSSKQFDFCWFSVDFLTHMFHQDISLMLCRLLSDGDIPSAARTHWNLLFRCQSMCKVSWEEIAGIPLLWFSFKVQLHFWNWPIKIFTWSHLSLHYQVRIPPPYPSCFFNWPWGRIVIFEWLESSSLSWKGVQNIPLPLTPAMGVFWHVMQKMSMKLVIAGPWLGLNLSWLAPFVPCSRPWQKNPCRFSHRD